MKKKMLALVLSMVIALSVVACGSDTKADDEKEATVVETQKIDNDEDKDKEEKSSKQSIDLNSKKDKAAESNFAGNEYITATPLGNDEYELTVCEDCTYVEFYACELNDNFEYVVTEMFGDFETADEKSFDISYNTVSDTAAEALVILYLGYDVKSFALEKDGVNGDVIPVEIEIAYDTEDTYESDGDVATVDDYLKAWGAGRISIQVTGSKSGNYVFTVTWPDSAFQEYEWDYYCSYDPATGVMDCNGMADKFLITYSEDGECEMTSLYENGSGSFHIENGQLYWYDLEEGYGDDLVFE